MPPDDEPDGDVEVDGDGDVTDETDPVGGDDAPADAAEPASDASSGRSAAGGRAGVGGSGGAGGGNASSSRGDADGSGGGSGDGDGDGDSGLGRSGWAKRGLTALAVALVVAVVLGAVPALLAGSAPEPAQLNNSEYAVDRLAVSQFPAKGEIEPDVSGSGTVVIDDSHANRYTRADLLPLYEAFAAAGYEVRIHESGTLADSLADADALVVIDPGQKYTSEDIEDITSFTDRGGRLLVLGEPNRVRVTAGLGGVSVTEVESELTALAAAYDVSVGTEYVYNQQRHDGNYKNPLASPVNDADGAGEDVALYTAASVRPLDEDAEVVLRTRRGTRLADSDTVRRYPVAVRSENALVVGDSTFVTTGRYNVADNEVFLAYVVEFLLSGDVEPPEPPSEGNGGGDGGSENGTDTGG